MKDIVAVSTPFLVFLWIITGLILIGPADYGGYAILNTATLFISIGIISILSFAFFTHKKFVDKCQKMREFDQQFLEQEHISQE